MAVVSACPDVQLLQQLALGRMSPAEVECLAKHCEQCERCIQLLQTMKAEDTLAEAMAAQGTAPEQPREPAVDALIERLKRTPPPAPEAERTAAFAANDPPSVSLESTQAGDISLAPPQAADEIGRLGGYRVLKILGAGGMGMVYQAEDVHLQRAVALKVMKPDVAKNPSARERFLREARAAAKLHSDHVVNIFQVGEDNQVVFLAMEFLEGMALDDWLKKGRTPTLTQAARIGRQIALGLADAHACGLIHRDIKPGNIWLDSRHQGRVKLLDFGLARGDRDEIHLTQSGAIVGTPAYMAPEQARGEHVDHRVDLFSLGVVLYRLTTGQLPFRGDNTMSILTSLALDAPPPPREINPAIPPRLASLIERLLSKDREQRPASAKAAADELAAIEREATQPAADERTVQVQAARAPIVRAAHAAQRSKRLRWLAAAALLFLLGGAAAAIVVIIRDKDGNKIAEVNVPPGGSAEVKDDGKGKAEVKVPPVAPPAAPLPSVLPGEPLSPVALVQRPAKLPGVRSWSIESRNLYDPAAMAYRPDGKRLAVVCGGGVFRIWEPESGRLVQVLLESDAVGSLAWSPDGRTLALGCRGKQLVHLWDAETGRFLRGLEAPAAGFGFTLAWSDDGRKVRAVMHGSTACHTWNASDGKLLGTVQIPCHYHTFSPNGKQMAGRIVDGPLAVWDVETGKEVRQLGTPTSTLMNLAWSADGKRLAAAETKGIRVWDVDSGKESFAHKDENGGSPAWSPDGRRMVYNLPGNTGWATLKLDPGAKPERREGWAAVHAWSPDGKSIARLVYHLNYGLHLYDAASGKRLRSLSEGVGDLLFAFSPAGRMIALSELSGKTFLSSVDTGQTAGVLKDTYGPPLAWSPDGKTLAKGEPNHTVDLWDDGGQTRIKLTGHQADVSYLAWSSDGKRLASSSLGEKRVLLWDADKAEKLRELGPFPAPAHSLTWSPEGRFVAFVLPEVGWHFWDVEQNKLANDPKEWKDNQLVFSPDGRSALVANFKGPYRLRDRASGKEARSLPYAADTYRAHPVWSPDGRLLAVPVNWGVELWRGDLSRRVRTLHSTWPLMYQIAFSPDGKWTFGQAGERLHVWETDTGRLSGILLLGEANHGLTLTAEGHYSGNEQVEHGIVMVVQKDDGTQEVLEPADFEQKYGFKNDPNKVHLLQPLPPPLYPLPGMPMGPRALVREPAELPDANSWTIETVSARGKVNAVAYRPDGKLLATGGEDGTIRLWDTSSGKLIRMLVGEKVKSLAWSKDGKVLTAGYAGEGEGCEWDADTGWLLRRVTGATIPAAKTARSPDGKQTATADDHGVHLCDAADGKREHTLETARSVVPNLSLSPDGRRLLLDTWSIDPVIVVDIATGQPLPSPAEAVFDAAWSPDGKLLAASAPGGRVRLWNAVSREPVRTLDGRLVGHVGPLAWSADSKKVAAANNSHVWVWSAETGKLLWHNDKQQNVGRVAWSPQGQWLATNDIDGKTVRIWEADSGKLVHEMAFFAWDLSWSPDDKTLAAGAGGMTGEECRLIDVASGVVRLTIRGQFTRWSADGKTLVTNSWWGLLTWDAATGAQQSAVPHSVLPLLGPWWPGGWSADGRLLARGNGYEIHLCQGDGQPLGVLLWGERSAQLAVTADGRYRGNARVERAIRMVVQKRDGSSETLTVGEFEQKYGFKNDPAKVRLTD